MIRNDHNRSDIHDQDMARHGQDIANKCPTHGQAISSDQRHFKDTSSD